MKSAPPDDARRAGTGSSDGPRCARGDRRRAMRSVATLLSGVVNSLNAAAEILETLANKDDEEDALVAASDRPFGLSPDTFRRWAKQKRFPSFVAERGRIVAWKADVKSAIESDPYEAKNVRDEQTGNGTDDAFVQAIRAGKLRKL